MVVTLPCIVKVVPLESCTFEREKESLLHLKTRSGVLKMT